MHVLTTILILLSIIFQTETVFLPRLPFTTKIDCLINIVVSSKSKCIPTSKQKFPDVLIHTFTIHENTSPDFAISKNSLLGINTVNTKMGYFRHISKHIDGPILFLMFTNNIFETFITIHKSRFQSSDEVLFFSYVYELNHLAIECIYNFFQLVSRTIS